MFSIWRAPGHCHEQIADLIGGLLGFSCKLLDFSRQRRCASLGEGLRGSASGNFMSSRSGIAHFSDPVVLLRSPGKPDRTAGFGKMRVIEIRVTNCDDRIVVPASDKLQRGLLQRKMVDDDVLNAWFVREVLPLERALTAFVRRNWKVPEDVFELRQDIYEHALIGARRALPQNTRAYIYTVARNHLINQAKRARIVPIEMFADLDAVSRDIDMFETERALTARDELRRAKEGIDKLPPKCREVVILHKIDGLTDREASETLGVSVETVRRQVKLGMKALIDHMLGGSGRIVRKNYSRHSDQEAQS